MGMSRLHAGGLAVLVVAAIAACAEGDDLDGAADAGERPSFVLVSIDTLRPDHLGAYGYERLTSPNIDAFARESVVFEQAISSSSSTLVAHASMFTSLTPARHGAVFSESIPLAPERETLAEALQAAGWHTAAFHGGGQVAPEFGLDQGFDRYERVVPRFSRTVAHACDEIRDRRDERFFLFLHTYEVHHPYTPDPELLALFKDEAYDGPLPDKIGVSEHLQRINAKPGRPKLDIGPEDVAHIIATYDAEIRSMDRAFGRLLSCLTEAGRDHDTVVILTSDHGEEFGEHGTVGWHSHTLFDELVRTPLIVRFPGRQHAGLRIPGFVRTIDVAPTVLAIAGLEAPATFQGRPLLDLLEAGGTRQQEHAVLRLDSVLRRHRGVRTDRWKLHGRKLFDLHADPREQRDVSGEHPDVVERLQAIVRADAEAAVEGATPHTTLEVDEQTEADLRALGYVGD